MNAILHAIRQCGEPNGAMVLLSDVRKHYAGDNWRTDLLSALRFGTIALYENDQPRLMADECKQSAIVLDGKTYWACSIR